MNEYNNGAGYALDWDDEIQYTESSFVLLPAGEYPFTVTGFDRQNFDGSDKVPPCKMAVLHLAVNGGDQGTANVDERLYLHTAMMWKLSEFFTAIGQLQKDGSVRMNWNAVPGSTGRVKLSVNQYKNKKGEDRTNNRVEHFLAPDNAAQTSNVPTPQSPAATAPLAKGGREGGASSVEPTWSAPQWQQPAPGQGPTGQQTAMDGFQRQGRMGDYQAEKF